MPGSELPNPLMTRIVDRLRWSGVASDPSVAGGSATLARAFTYLFGSGGVLVLISLLLPGAPDRTTLGIAAPAVVAVGTAALILWRFERLPHWVFVALPPFGAVLVTVAVASAGGTAVSVYAMIYFWVVLAAFSFLSRGAGIFNLVLVAIAYGGTLLLVGGTTEIELRWLLAIGALVVAGLLISAHRGHAEQLVADLRQHSEQQDVVAEVGRLALSGASLDQLAEWAAQAVTRNLRADHAGVFRLLADERMLILRAGVGWNPDVGEAATVTVEEPLLGAAIKSDRPVIANRLEGEADEERRRLDPHGHGAPATGCRRMPPSGRGASGVAVAIGRQAEPSGVLAAYSCQGARFTASDAAFLQAVANVLADAEQRREAELQARRQALLDPLTGRPTRVLFMDRLEEALLRARADGEDIAVLIVDIDDFHLVNDVSGRQVGDAILRQFAPRLRGSLVLTDTVARVGADEFAILLEHPRDRQQVISIAERILESVRAPFVAEGDTYRVSASIGIVNLDGGDVGADALIGRAETAAQSARARGHGRWEMFDEAVLERMRTRLDLSRALREAPARGELSLAVQPIRYLAGEGIHSSEVLLRWRHPQLGEVPPAEFIPVAEDSGAIVEIGAWVLGRACELAALWRADDRTRALLPLNVNVSPAQLVEHDFSRMVALALARAGASPRDLGLEITEQAVLRDHETAAVALGRLRDMGVRILLDDFGTGYSSLNHLKQLPIDAVKIDRSFIVDSVSEPRGAAIISAITAMAGAFVIEVIAEGVESSDHVEALRSLGCLVGQGYYLGRPVAPESLASSDPVAARASSIDA